MKIGVAFGGGGVKGAVHIGVLRAFSEHSIPVHCVSGTSSGSIIAALHAVGYTPVEIENIFKVYASAGSISKFFRFYSRKKIVDIDYWGAIKFLFSGIFLKNYSYTGIVKGNLLRKTIDNYCGEKDCLCMKDIKIPIAIPAVDLCSGEAVYFSNKQFNSSVITDTSITEAVISSSAFPALFRMREFENYKLIDGGILDNIPVEVLPKIGADFCISVACGKFKNYCRKKLNFIGIYERSIDILRHRYEQMTDIDVNFAIEVDLPEIGLLQVNKIDECIELGYKTAIKIMPRLKETIEDHQKIIRR